MNNTATISTASTTSRTLSRFFQKSLLEHLLSISAAVVSRCSMLLVTIINTQIMPAEEFGVFVVLLLIANIVTAFVSCGGDMWLNRFTRPRHSTLNRAPIVSRIYLTISLCLASTVILTALYFGIFNKIAFDGRGLAIALCLLWAATMGLIESILAILRATNAIQRFFMIRDFFMPIALISCICIFKTDTVEKFFIMAFIVGIITLSTLAKLMYQKKQQYLPPFDTRDLFFNKMIMGHTTALIFNNLLARLANGQDALLLARIDSIATVGKYRFVSHFAYAFNLIQHFVFLAFPWQLRHASVEGIHLDGIRAVKFRQLLLLASAFPVLIILIFIAKPLLAILGDGFQLMALPFTVSLIIRFSELLWGPQHEILISNKKVNLDTLANFIAIAVGVLVFFIALQWKDGITTGLLSVGCSSIASQLTRFLILKKHRLLKKEYSFILTPGCPLLVVCSSIVYLILR